MFTLYCITGHKIDEFGTLRLEPGYITYETPIQEPYIVMHFPVIARETIEDKLNGVIFNHGFKHSHVDHWLGYYAAQHEEYKPYNYSLFKDLQTSFVKLNTGTNYRNATTDNYDYNQLNVMYQKFLQNPKTKYND